mgnify:CR=1 FL=1
MKVFSLLILFLSILSCQDDDVRRIELNDKSLKKNKEDHSSYTFEKDVRSILQSSCLPCHNEKSPLNWMDYDITAKYSEEILETMNGKREHVITNATLSKSKGKQIEVIKEWIENGMEKGELSEREDIDVKKINDQFAKSIYESKCSQCHENTDDYPILKGQPRAYLIEQLNDFKLGHRINTSMSANTNKLLYTQGAIESMADYLSELMPCFKRKPIKQFENEQFENGKKIYNNKCLRCHGKNLFDAPNIKGLNKTYLQKTLMDLKNNYRPDSVMTEILLFITKEDIEDISLYLSTQSFCKD